MAAKLTPEQLEAAIGLQRQGKTQQEIASTLGVQQPCVSRALGRHNRNLMARLEKRGAEQKAKQVDRLEYLYAEIVGEWHRSKLDAETVKQTEDAAGVKTETTVKGQTGNPALIAQARGVMEDIRSILGLDAPAATSVDVTSGGKPADYFAEALARGYGGIAGGGTGPAGP